MTIPTTLRPMTVGDLLDSAFRLYRKHFLTFIGIVALLLIPLLILTTLIQFVVFGDAMADILGFTLRPTPVPGGSPGANPLDFFPITSYIIVIGASLILGLVQYLVVYNLITGALARATARSFMGQEVSILDSYRIGWRAFFSLVGASLLPYLATFVVVALVVGGVFAVAFFAATGLDSGIMTAGAIAAGLGLFALVAVFIIGTIVLYVRFLFATQAIVLEGQGPINALGRSWRLSRGNFWRTFLVIFLMGILSYLISGLPASGVNLAVTLTMRSTEALLLGSFATTLVSYIGLILALPLQFCVYTQLYYDLRVRREGYDLELRVQEQATGGNPQQAGVIG